MRNLIKSYVKRTIPDPPLPIPVMEIPTFTPEFYCTFYDLMNITTPIKSD